MSNNEDPRAGELEFGISYLTLANEEEKKERLRDMNKILELFTAVSKNIEDADSKAIYDKEIQLLKFSYKDARLNITDKKEQEQRIAMIDGVYDKLMSEITSVKSMNNSIDSRQK